MWLPYFVVPQDVVNYAAGILSRCFCIWAQYVPI